MVCFLGMMIRNYLSELKADGLYELLNNSKQNEAERSVTEGTNPVHDLYGDLKKSYPGIVDVAERIWEDLEQNDASMEFMAGAMAGSLLMLHTIRLAVEHDEISAHLPD